MIPDHATWEILPIFVAFQYFLLDSSVFSNFQFLGNFLHSFLYEDGSSSPIHFTSVFSHAELDLPIDWLPVIVVFEIQALVASPSTHILNFFALSSGSPGRTQSNIIFSELNFHQEQLVELFVPGLLRDLVQQSRILCESEENDSSYCCRRLFFDIDSAPLITEPSLSSLSLCLAGMLSWLSP